VNYLTTQSLLKDVNTINIKVCHKKPGAINNTGYNEAEVFVNVSQFQPSLIVA